MIDRILKTIRKFNIINSKDKVLVAVSGGPDSIALLHILNSLKEHINFNIYAAHLNHMFRGQEAEGDAKFVEEFCQSLGIPATIEAINVTEYMKKTGLSSQVAAREVRYDFLKETAKREGCNKIALGHHADDQVETILMNYMRGTGSKGLKGMEIINRQYIRPLLFIRRYEIEEYCRINNLNWRLDSSNLKDIYSRNKIRHKLIPFLEQEFNPNIVGVINQTANIIRDEYDFIEEITEDFFNKLMTLGNKTNERSYQISFSANEFNSLAIAIKRRLLIKVWIKLTGDSRDLDYKHLEKIIEFVNNGPANGQIDLPKGYFVKKEYDNIEMSNIPDEHAVSIFNKVIDIPGDALIEDLNTIIKSELLLEKPLAPLKPNEILLDLDKVSLPIIIRNRLPGDKIRPLGMNGTKKLKDFFIDEKIPIEKRDEIPLILDQKGIIWIGGIRQCAGYEVDDETTRFLLLKIEDIN